MKESTATRMKAPAKKSDAAQSNTPSSARKKPLVGKQPRSKQQAAVQAGMFLYTDDTWAIAYFDEDDLHCLERELFG
jgi:hypothetical protein